LHVTTQEQTTSQANDKLRVQVRRANGQLTTLGTFSNLQVARGYAKKTFEGVEDNGSLTSFLVDDIATVIEP